MARHYPQSFLQSASMGHCKHYCFVLLCMLLLGCQREDPIVSHLIVEGWIEPGEHPVVMLHRSCPYSQIDTAYQDVQDLVEDYLIPFGKVTISDGDTTVVLTGRVSRDYMPPYTYSSVYMKGEVGKTYRLTAQYRDFYATAQTTIPLQAGFDSILVEQHGDDRMSIVGVINQAAPRSHYLIFVHYPSQPQYQLCPLGVIATPDSITDLRINVYSPYSSDKQMSFSNAMFRKSDSGIFIKIASVSEEEFAFWESFAATSLTAGTLFVPMRQNIHSNIQGGIGYWSGMGSTEYFVQLSHTRTYSYPR